MVKLAPQENDQSIAANQMGFQMKKYRHKIRGKTELKITLNEMDWFNFAFTKDLRVLNLINSRSKAAKQLIQVNYSVKTCFPNNLGN